jgi:hypothetical protein
MGGDLARVVDVVLDRHRHTEQRGIVAGGEPLLGTLRVGAGLLGEDDAKRVQLGLDSRDALQIEVDQLAGRDLTVAHHLRDPSGAGEGDLVVDRPHHAHRRHPSASSTSSAARAPERTAPSM